MQERLVTLEEKVAHLEETVNQLSTLVYELRRRGERHDRMIKDLRKHTTPIDTERTEADDVPPHWGPPREQ